MDGEVKDEEAVAAEIEQMLVAAWKKFCDYYNEKAPEYRNSWEPGPLNEKDAKESHWICWNENDLTFHIGRFFYDILSTKKEEKFSNIEMHFEKKVDSINFKGYEFENRLEKLKGRLIRKGVIKKGKSKEGGGPKVDMIIAYEHSKDSFLLCAEVKYFHCASRKGVPNPEICNDIEKLKALKDYKIAKRAVFMLFDDYYWYKRGGKTAKKIEDKLKRIEQEKNDITVLSYRSEAKMCGFRPDC